MQLNPQENFSKELSNICSDFIDKGNLGCYNNGTSNHTFEGTLLAMMQWLIAQQQPFSFLREEKDGTLPRSPALNSRNLPFFYKEDMYRQEKLTALLKVLAATPNSDEHIAFVLQLAEESVSADTLRKLVKNNAAIQSDVGQQRLDDVPKLKFTNQEINQMPKTFRKRISCRRLYCANPQKTKR